MNKLVAYKMDGLGNDFIIFDKRKKSISLAKDQIIKISDRNNIGCDQVIFIDKDESSNASLKFYNADGGEISACGNGSRCVAYLLMNENKSKKIFLKTKGGILEAELKNNNLVKINMGQPNFGWKKIPLSKEIDNKNLRSLLSKCNTNNFLTYGFDKNSNYQIINVKKNVKHSVFDLKIKFLGDKILKIKNIRVNLIGDHNISNATASVAIALNLGIKISKIKRALKKFLGIQRRFTKVLSLKKREFYDDYAHHPTEIRAVINSARQVHRDRKIICVFQPHRYSRVKFLKNEFALSFKESDAVVLCPVYSAGEKNNYNFDQKKFSQLIAKKSRTQVVNISNQKDLKNYFKKNLQNNEIIICMGAGSISNWIRKIGNDLK